MGRYLKRYRIDLDNYFLAEKIKKIISQEGVEYTFDKEGDGGDRGIFGHYEIEVSNYMVDTGPIEKYRIVELTVDDYHRLVCPPKKDSFQALDAEYHDMIEDEFDKRLKAKKEEWARDIVNSYKEEFNRYIDDEVSKRYSELLDRFHDDQCRYSELSRLYKAEIDASIEHRTSVFFDKVYKVASSRKYEYDKQFLTKLFYLMREIDKKENLYFCDDEYVLQNKIGRMKNDFVEIVSGSECKIMGRPDYLIQMKKRGKIADFLEHAMYFMFIYGRRSKENYGEAYSSIDDIISKLENMTYESPSRGGSFEDVENLDELIRNLY